MTEDGYRFDDRRPWGGYEILIETDSYKVKRMVVSPNKILSYQYHNWRQEDWMIVKGTATVTLNDVACDYGVGEHIFIPIGAKHRVENTGSEDLIFIEVQTGTYFGEDDIVRIQDEYKRI